MPDNVSSMLRLLLFTAVALHGCADTADEDEGDEDEDVGMSAAECDTLVGNLEACTDGYCDSEGVGSELCGCWGQGMDISLADCTCVPFDGELVCDYYDANGLSADDFSCSLAQSTYGNICN